MTHNQIAHAQNVETNRHNVAYEKETNRHNLVSEDLEQRKLDLQEWANRLQEQGLAINAQHYSNVDANTAYDNATKRLSVDETARHNAATETIQVVSNSISADTLLENARHNKENEQIANYNATTQRLSQMSQHNVNEANIALTNEKAETESFNRASLVSETFKDSMMGLKFGSDILKSWDFNFYKPGVVSLFAR